MMEMVSEGKDKVLIRCAFCNGHGKDPFGVMSRLSTCYACMGEKTLWVGKPLKVCPYCTGTGVSPVGARNYCLVCRGAGMVTLEEPSRTCPACGGSGSTRPHGLYCVICAGKGAIPLELEV